MVRVRSTRRLTVGGRLTPLLIALAIAAAGGCTMCPDPFDYSGPVPNGSPPQNDFRARSGGIHPLGAAPRPWPQVVRADGDATESAPAGGEERTVETVSVLEPAADVTGEEEPLTPEAPETTLEPVPAEATGKDDAPPDTAGALKQPAPEMPPSEDPVASPSLPPAGETPGWRPRR